MTLKRLKRLTCLVLALVMALSLIGAPGVLGVSRSEIDALEREKKAISEQKDEAKGILNQLQGEQASALDQKYAYDTQNELARQEIELINEQIEIYDNLIAEKEEELVEAKAQEDYQKERFRTRIRAMEEDGSLGYIAFVFKATSFSDLLTRMDNISEIMESDKSLEDKYIAARENVEQVKAEYEEVQAEQLIKREEMQERKAELEKQIEAAIEIIAALQGEIDLSQEELDKIDAAEKGLQSEIESMLAALKKQEEAAKAAGKGGAISSTGTYVWPMPGYSPGSAYGWRMHPIFHEMRFHAGEDIGAANGTPIIAADSGTVIMAGVNGGYGNCVMINHGGGRVTLYAHQSSMAVSVGQSVSQGQVIGYVGSTGNSTGPHLHFEVRVNGATTDPKTYFNFG